MSSAKWVRDIIPTTLTVTSILACNLCVCRRRNINKIGNNNKKFELMLTTRAKAYSSFGSVV